MSLAQLIGFITVLLSISLGLWLLSYFKKRIDKLFYQALVKALSLVFVLLLLQTFFIFIDRK